MRRSRRRQPSLLSLREALAWIFESPPCNGLLGPAISTISNHAHTVIEEASAQDLMFVAVDDDAHANIACTAIAELLRRADTPANVRIALRKRARVLVPGDSTHPIHRALNEQLRAPRS